MLSAIACLIGIFGLLVIAELLGKYRILKGEYHRKFLHITAGSFIAFWPWFTSWHFIEFFGLASVAVMLANRYWDVLNYRGRVGRATYGDIFLALAVSLCAFWAHNKLFFTAAILEIALADGLAAVAGRLYGKGWGYKVYKNQKTVIGSMVFWLASVFILGVVLLGAYGQIPLSSYYLILLLLPPALTVAENFAGLGLDNLAVPLIVILVLRLAEV